MANYPTLLSVPSTAVPAPTSSTGNAKPKIRSKFKVARDAERAKLKKQQGNHSLLELRLIQQIRDAHATPTCANLKFKLEIDDGHVCTCR